MLQNSKTMGMGVIEGRITREGICWLMAAASAVCACVPRQVDEDRERRKIYRCICPFVEKSFLV